MNELIGILWGVAFALSFISSYKFFQHWFLYGSPLVAFGGKSVFRDERIIGKHTNELNVCGKPEFLKRLDEFEEQYRLADILVK